MTTAKLFKVGKGQAVRLPEEFRFEGTEVFVKRVGNAVVLMPANRGWDSLIASLDQFLPDFMASRVQPAVQDDHKRF